MSRFRRRLMGLSALRQAAADDFVRVEYLENISNAYIDTLIKPIANRRYVLDFAFTSTDSLQQNGCMQDLGNGTFNRCHFGIRGTLIDFQGCLQRSIYNWQPVDTNRHIWEIGYRNVKFDDTTKGTTTNDNYLPNVTFCIFARKVNEQVQDFCMQRVYSFKIYNGDLLVRDFIPMYQKSKDLYGLWDRVENKFYTSPNGVKFTGGARVVADANDNLYYIKNYISSNDSINAYITLRKFSNTDKIEFKIYKKRGNDAWFGSRAATPVRNHFAVNGYGGGINMNYGSNNPIRIVNGVANNMAHTIRVYNREVFLDGKKIYTWGTNTFTTNSNVTLGKVDGITNLASNCNWYYFKWWNVNKDLVYDLIPVQSVDSGKYGMFDKVSLVFHPSNGSANFIGG